MIAIVPPAPLVEPIAVPDTFCSGLARIEDLGACLRFTFFTLQRPVHAGDEHAMERVVVARLVLSNEATTAAALKALVATGTHVFAKLSS